MKYVVAVVILATAIIVGAIIISRPHSDSVAITFPVATTTTTQPKATCSAADVDTIDTAVAAWTAQNGPSSSPTAGESGFAGFPTVSDLVPEYLTSWPTACPTSLIDQADQ